MDYAVARAHMVDGQIRTNKVVDPELIAALRELPRELFVPSTKRAIAYIDEDVEVAPGRYLTEPMILARLLQAARLGPDTIALDIGPATGYSTALLARLAGTVVGIESEQGLADEADRLLQQLGIDNATVICSEMRAGYLKQAPYDVILINGAVDEVPTELIDQLAEGGRLVTVLGGTDVIGAVGRATVLVNASGTISKRAIFDAATPSLPGFERRPSFTF